MFHPEDLIPAHQFEFRDKRYTIQQCQYNSQQNYEKLRTK